MTGGARWVPTVTEGPGLIRYLVISNIGEEIQRLDHRLDVEQSAPIPRVRVRRVTSLWECQNLALGSTRTLRSRQNSDHRIPRNDRYFAGQNPLILTEIER
ncbi:hypothetical protein PHMEG_00038377 [Phytophthora megakarya]|uniref:Reverse transcriptase n=1 Tax=Phytophthora megakarya TaxID=4795 RepID=A0A225UI01_9STRA|nr:hypothetical protein PHMEG_00038377 [Phytophthora megakarya]